MLQFGYFQTPASCALLVLDIDGTLIVRKRNNAWRWRSEILHALPDNQDILLLSNQAGWTTNSGMRTVLRDVHAHIAQHHSCMMRVATQYDAHRKPSTGALEDMLHYDAICIVGDAAGRIASPGLAGDHADSDYTLALNLRMLHNSVEFLTPEAFANSSQLRTPRQKSQLRTPVLRAHDPKVWTCRHEITSVAAPPGIADWLRTRGITTLSLSQAEKLDTVAFVPGMLQLYHWRTFAARCGFVVHPAAVATWMKAAAKFKGKKISCVQQMHWLSERETIYWLQYA